MKILIVTVIMILSANARAAFKALDSELTTYPYPFAVKFFEVKFPKETYRMAYMHLRPAKRPRGSVILLHGKNFSGNYWERTANDLVKEDYEVIIPDQIGFGKSSKPESFPFSLPLLARLTNELVKSLEVKNHIVMGHSMGGMLAMRYALMFPQEVQKLILVNPIGLEDWQAKTPCKDIREIYQDELKTNEDSIHNYQKNVYYAGQWKPEYDKGIEILVGWTLHKEYPRIAWVSALTTQMLFTEPVINEVENLKMPTLLIVGTRDRTALGKNWAKKEVAETLGRYDVLGKSFIKRVPKGKLVEFDNIGHMPQVETYGDYIKAVKEFL